MTILALAALSLQSFASSSLKGDMKIWYSTIPDEKKEGPLPLGNGYLGALVYGHVLDERIALNETSFWSGFPHNYNDPEAGNYFEQIKQLSFASDFKAAEKLIDEHFYGIPVGQQAYEPLGNLHMRFFDVETVDATNYRRELDMETGITSVSYKVAGVTYKREAFISYPDNVLIVRLTADKPGSISLDTWLDSEFTDGIKVEKNEIVLDGQWEGPLPKYWLIGEADGKGLKFQTVLDAKAEGGSSEVHKDKLRIRKADSVTLILTSATSHVNYHDISANPAERTRPVMDRALSKDYETIKAGHVEAFSEKMDRVHLNLGYPEQVNDIPTDKRIANVENGCTDPSLEALCFQFGRYMLVCSSREGGQTANLQAIWNEVLLPKWGSKYTININIQMNYWPAEVTNLSETPAPLFTMLKDCSETGAETAKTYYGIDKGWVAHHNLDLWRGTAPVDAARFGIWPMGGAWLCQHIWEHYAFTKDEAFLKEYYPVMKGSAEFLLNLLTEYPGTDYLVTPFSMSPEHNFLDKDGTVCTVAPGPMMDMAIMRDLFPHVIEAAKILGTDTKLCKNLEKALKKLPPYKVNHLGYPQEWFEDFDYRFGGHDVSPYFPVFPGSSVQLHRDSDKEMVDSYLRWMESRGVGRGGFPSSWNVCMWARLENGDRTSAQILSLTPRISRQFLLQGTGAQVDAPFGYTAGLAECLLQSHAGEISLLPALPSHWRSGSVCGLKARGAYTVDIEWAKGKLTKATIKGQAGSKIKLRYCGKVEDVTIPADGKYVLECSCSQSEFDKNSPYYFDGSISRETLEHYLDRSVTAVYFLHDGQPEGYTLPNKEDDIRMLQNIGAKFIGRSIYRWGGESLLNDPHFLSYAKSLTERMHDYDPEIVFQGCLFEYISADVNKVAIPDWVFKAFNQPVEQRNFRVADMVRRLDPKATIRWGERGGGVPMVNNLESRMWFYFLAKSYIDIGCEAFHLGQVELIGADDPDKKYYDELLTMIRSYAAEHARRHYVLLDAHTPKGGFVKADGVSLLDFNSFPLRIKENVGKPMEGFLEVGHGDSIYCKSKGGISPSGWSAEHLPYLVEFDNFGSNGKVGVANLNDFFCWGYDDISWFSVQSEDYRNWWLHYAFDWLHSTDPNGHLQMCVMRMITNPALGRGRHAYYANTKSAVNPIGYSQENTIKELWKGLAY